MYDSPSVGCWVGETNSSDNDALTLPRSSRKEQMESRASAAELTGIDFQNISSSEWKFLLSVFDSTEGHFPDLKNIFLIW